jgi:hypothetical protein
VLCKALLKILLSAAFLVSRVILFLLSQPIIVVVVVVVVVTVTVSHLAIGSSVIIALVHSSLK